MTVIDKAQADPIPAAEPAVQRKLLDAAHNIFRAADGPRGPNAARALCKERLHD